jgi:ketosteroid isomerase-like protein
MKQTMVACVLAVCSLSAFGQAKSEAPKTSASVEQVLMQMERDWTKAGLNKDAAALDRIIADDWTAIDFQGKIETKAQALAKLADLKSGSSALQSVELGEMKVRVFGNTAVSAAGNCGCGAAAASSGRAFELLTVSAQHSAISLQASSVKLRS